VEYKEGLEILPGTERSQTLNFGLRRNAFGENFYCYAVGLTPVDIDNIALSLNCWMTNYQQWSL